MTTKKRLSSAGATAELAGNFAKHLKAGDTLLLSGDIGAGKTHFARSLIHALQAPLDLLEDVPSPTFTLVQTYPLGSVEIWHADLYRLSNIDEVFELGLLDAFETEICLIEWPNRLGNEKPSRHLALDFNQAAQENARDLTITPSGKGWDWIENV